MALEKANRDGDGRHGEVESFLWKDDRSSRRRAEIYVPERCQCDDVKKAKTTIKSLAALSVYCAPLGGSSKAHTPEDAIVTAFKSFFCSSGW